MTWIFGPQVWHLSEHAYITRRCSFPSTWVLLNNSEASSVKKMYIKCNLICLCQHHSPYPSHRRPLHSTSQQHEGLPPPWAHQSPPVDHKYKPFQDIKSSQTHVQLSQMIYFGFHGTKGVFFRSQLPPIKCANLCGAQNLNPVTTDGSCHSFTGSCLASCQRAMSSTWRHAFFSSSSSSLQDTFI